MNTRSSRMDMNAFFVVVVLVFACGTLCLAIPPNRHPSTTQKRICENCFSSVDGTLAGCSWNIIMFNRFGWFSTVLSSQPVTPNQGGCTMCNVQLHAKSTCVPWNALPFACFERRLKWLCKKLNTMWEPFAPDGLFIFCTCSGTMMSIERLLLRCSASNVLRLLRCNPMVELSKPCSGVWFVNGGRAAFKSTKMYLRSLWYVIMQRTMDNIMHVQHTFVRWHLIVNMNYVRRTRLHRTRKNADKINVIWIWIGRNHLPHASCLIFRMIKRLKPTMMNNLFCHEYEHWTHSDVQMCEISTGINPDRSS